MSHQSSNLTRMLHIKTLGQDSLVSLSSADTAVTFCNVSILVFKCALTCRPCLRDMKALCSFNTYQNTGLIIPHT